MEAQTISQPKSVENPLTKGNICLCVCACEVIENLLHFITCSLRVLNSSVYLNLKKKKMFAHCCVM